MSDSMNQKLVKSCLTDKPLHTHEEDTLKATDYANALCQFIIHADTPVTIGIQGSWGSGKTSLISVLREDLEHSEPHAALCVMVNAWEHSLFHDTESNAEVALSLLKSLSDGVKESVGNTSWLDSRANEAICEQGKGVDTAIQGLKLGLMFAGKVATQMLSNIIGGGDVSNVKLRQNNAQIDALPPIAENVHKLRVSLEEMIKKVTYNNNPVKIVFFIDDLDRVPPPTAVEILDITKNIFNIPNCVFVLAIDYEVVVKGLEEKFGKKSAENEREFRQYFDKIIQIPFTMPIGAYSDNLVDMILPALEQLGNITGDIDNNLLGKLADDARLATGGIPRSIKRIINTLSLLRYIDIAKQKKTDNNLTSKLLSNLEARFILVALHINFPEISSKLMEKPNFTEWKIEELDLPWKLNFKENREKLELLEKDEYFNDGWEKVVFCLASASTWLKSQAKNISKLLNNLLLALDEANKPDEKLSENSIQLLTNILDGIRVVSIDTESENIAQFDESSVKKDKVTIFFQHLQDALAEKLPDEIMPIHTKEWAKRGEYRPYEVSLNGDVFTKAIFEYDKSQDAIFVTIEATRHGVKKADAEDIIVKMAKDYKPNNSGRRFSYYLSKYFATKDFLDNRGNINVNSINQLVEETIKLYKTVDKVQKKLANM